MTAKPFRLIFLARRDERISGFVQRVRARIAYLRATQPGAVPASIAIVIEAWPNRRPKRIIVTERKVDTAA